jgi:hypothetical protein
MRIRMTDGREFEGTAMQIVQAMRSTAFDEQPTLVSYIEWVSRQIAEMAATTVIVEGTTEEEMARTLVEEMVRVGAAVRL